MTSHESLGFAPPFDPVVCGGEQAGAIAGKTASRTPLAAESMAASSPKVCRPEWGKS
jgi:hypothetical protein